MKMYRLAAVWAVILCTGALALTSAGAWNPAANSMAPAHHWPKLTQGQTASVEQWSYAAALDAATWGSPIVTMFNLRAHDALGPNAKAAPNRISRMENISTPTLSEEAGYVTPNVNTLYGFGFLDLGPEPMILSVPNSAGRYYMVEIVDMYTNAFAFAGGTATGYRGGTFALVGPGWKGSLPEGVRRIDCPTRWVLVQPRVHIINIDDLAAGAKSAAPSMSRALPPSPASRRRPCRNTTPSSRSWQAPSCRRARWIFRTRCNFGKSSRRPSTRTRRPRTR